MAHLRVIPSLLLLPAILSAKTILPIRVQGAAGDGSKAALAAAGANSFRTWDVDEKTGVLLDEAQQNGLKVMLGIWLGHERHGFDYNDFDQVAKQREKVRKAVEAHKDHPAVLCWALGNEMEGFGAGDKPAIWGHIDSLASMVKKMDPHHPVATVIAEIGGRKVEAIHKLCPNVDIVGINSYGGVKSLPQRYRKAGGTKPYVVTEYGPNGTWETQKTSFGAVPELTSSQKAKRYGDAFLALQADGLCLGSYAFTWGYKQEGTATWFGMLLPGGRHLGAVDTLQELWTGKPPANRCPIIEPLKTSASVTEQGQVITVLLDAKDPEGDPLKTEWILMDESQDYNTGGDFRESPNSFPGAILESSNSSAKIRMPDNGGTYRIYATVTDPHNGAATANLPLFVKGQRKEAPASKVSLPFTPVGKYYPTGWMGNTAAMDLKEGETLHLQYKANDNWGGIVWQHPPNDWGDKPGGYDLSGAKRLVFRAKGEQGGEVATFSMGIIGKDKPHHDSAKAEKKVTLTPDWQTYALDLSGKDLSRIKSGFCITVAGQGRPLSIDIQDIRYE
jgi:hypothetical protein